MAKNDKTSKTAPAPKAQSEPKSGSKTGGVDRKKERAFIARTGFKVVVKDTTTSKASKCPCCKSSFLMKSAYDIHRKSCGVPSHGSFCTTEDFSNPSYLPISEIRGDKYREANKRKAPWTPAFELQKQFNVVVDEETGRTERCWVTVTKYRDFRAMLENDGVDVLDENGEVPQYIDPEDVNVEGDDLPIIDDE